MKNKKTTDLNLKLYAITPNLGIKDFSLFDSYLNDANSKDIEIISEDHKIFMEYFKKIELALENGVTLLQLREKFLDGDTLLNLAMRVKSICDKYNVPLIINDHPEIAKKVDAAGVHVGQSDTDALRAREILGYDKIIGVSAKTLEEAKKAEENGADYLGVGAIFDTNSKDNAQTISMETLDEIIDNVGIPVVAIGGLHYENIMKLSSSKVSGISVISEIFSADLDSIAEKTIIIKKRIEHMLNSTLPTVLTIAGSDPSGGAGIQADIKTLAANEVFSTSAITALTAQNSKRVIGIEPVSPDFLKLQLEAVFEAILPDAIKIGMVENLENAKVIYDILKKYKTKNIVIDPLMISSSGKELIKEEAIEFMEEKLFPIASLITPNLNEAFKLSGIKESEVTDIDKNTIDKSAIEKLGKILYNKYNTNILIKGGHNLGEKAMDLLIEKDCLTWFSSNAVKNPNTHGTGCTLSSAIAANLAKGYGMTSSICLAKKYLTRVIKSCLNLCEVNGPMDHSLVLGKDLR